MLDHIGIPVSDYARSLAFYTRALAPLGIDLIMEVTPEMTGNGSAAGFGSDGKPYFWFGDDGAPGTPRKGFPRPPPPPGRWPTWPRSF